MKKRPRSPWPYAIAAGLAAAVGINLTMVWIAVAHPSAMVAGDHEADALTYDRVIEARAAAQELGWQVDVQPCAAPDADGCEIVFEVRDRDGRAVPGLHGTVDARRADAAALDRTATIEATDVVGRYRAAVQFARPGMYALAIVLDGGPARWFDERTFAIGAMR